MFSVTTACRFVDAATGRPRWIYTVRALRQGLAAPNGACSVPIEPTSRGGSGGGLSAISRFDIPAAAICAIRASRGVSA
jgi:hypothetical protein